MTSDDARFRYDADVLAGGFSRRKTVVHPEQPADTGMAVAHRASDFAGRVVAADAAGVTIRDATGRVRVFRYAPGAFEVGGEVVTLVRPRSVHPRGPTPGSRSGGGGVPAMTASGSRAGPHGPAQVARASRIYVEGVHDAELLEKVWGDDLRELAVVVEPMDGVDDLPALVRDFAPGPNRRLGVLVDHLLPGTKEQRIAASVAHPHVLVTGHPYVDVWQAVRPKVLGIAAWPSVPRPGEPGGRPWKEGICAAFGASDPGRLWRQILAGVHDYTDLEPGLVGAVELLLDFLTE